MGEWLLCPLKRLERRHPSARIIERIGHRGPAVVCALPDIVDLVSASRAMLVFKQAAIIGDKNTLRVTVAIVCEKSLPAEWGFNLWAD